jgi:two-component system response regulator MprA
MLIASPLGISAGTARAERGEAGNFPRTAEKPVKLPVLVVDDEPLVRWSIAETLASQGYEVREAGDALSAIGAVSDPIAPPAAVFLDLCLPDCHDLRVLSAIRRLSPETAVIVMTAFDSPHLREDVQHLGAFTLVRKPFDMDDVGPLVERALAARGD